MPKEGFFALLTAVALCAVAAEYAVGRAQGRDWHDTRDTLANLNLAAGNLVMAVVWGGLIVAGYSAIHRHAVVDLSFLPLPAWLLVGFLLCELLQYWTHRLSHSWNLLWWGHVTHHSSSHLNLSTGPRVNWFYRGMAWILYFPLPLLGYGIEAFIGFQAVMNLYNLLCHTRLRVPMGPLRWVLVTPAAHRLHHTSDPRHFGNYGASLIVWDRLFGTHREVGDEEGLSWGIAHNVDEASPLRLNFHHLVDLWETARTERRSFLALLLSFRPATAAVRRPAAHGRVGPALLAGCALVAGLCITVNQLTADGGLAFRAGLWATALAACIAYGRWLGVRQQPLERGPASVADPQPELGGGYNP